MRETRKKSLNCPVITIARSCAVRKKTQVNKKEEEPGEKSTDGFGDANLRGRREGKL